MRIVLFILFFSVGAASLGASVLCEDLVQYYQNRHSTVLAQESLERAVSLNDTYDQVLQRLKDDPNQLKRLAPATLGQEQDDPNTVYPRVTARQLAAARRALTETDEDLAEQVIPNWLSRCSEPKKRMVIFFSGVVLILISFVCFRPAKPAQYQ